MAKSTHDSLKGKPPQTSMMDELTRMGLVCAAAYSMMVEPFCAGFDVRPPDAFLVFCSTIADLCFILHMCSRFLTGYEYMARDGQWKTEMRVDRIALRYLTGSFLLDLVTSLPVQIGIIALPADQSSWFLRLVGFSKGLRVIMLDREATKLLGSREVRGTGFFEAKMCVVVLLLCHWVACAWFWWVRAADDVLVPYPQEPLVCVDRALLLNATEGDRYLCALEWASQTLGGVGKGEMRPITSDEVGFAFFSMLAGAWGLCLLISIMRGLWMKQHVGPEAIKGKVRDTMAYLNHRRVPSKIFHIADSLSRFLWDTTRGYDDFAALSKLPLSVQVEAFRFLHADIVNGVEFLKDEAASDEEFWRILAGELRSEVFVAGSWIFREGGAADRIYIVKDGEAELVQESSDFVFSSYGRGTWFGETRRECPKGRKTSARAVGHCTLLELTEESLHRITRSYPQVWRKISELAAIRMRRNVGMRWKVVWKVHRERILERAASMTRPLPPWPCQTMERYRMLAHRLEGQMMNQYVKRTESGKSAKSNFFTRALSR